jgi:hypothetical protein
VIGDSELGGLSGASPLWVQPIRDVRFAPRLCCKTPLMGAAKRDSVS